MTGFILSLFVFSLFIIFAVLQIIQGKNDIKNSKGYRWKNALRIVFAAMILSLNVLLIIIVLFTYIE